MCHKLDKGIKSKACVSHTPIPRLQTTNFEKKKYLINHSKVPISKVVQATPETST